MTRSIPPQLVLLSIIAKSENGLTFNELTSYILSLCKSNALPKYYYTCGKGEGIAKEVLLDVNTLKVLGLVTEVNGKLHATEKGYTILRKVSANESNKIAKT
ncbi:MAG: hypothetical protein QXM55_01120 [Ignisphaera sp.]